MADADHLTPCRNHGLGVYIRHSGYIAIKQNVDDHCIAWHKLTGLRAQVWISINGVSTIQSIKRRLGSSEKVDAILKKMEEFRLITIVDKAES